MWLVRAIVLQIALVVGFVGLLLLGERTFPSFFALYLPRLPLLVLTLVAAIVAGLLRHRVLVVVQLALTAVVLFPVMGLHLSSSRPPLAPDRRISFMSYNVHFGKEGRAALLDELDAHRADIVVLQAAYDSLGDRLREHFPECTVRQDHELVLVTRFRVLDVQAPVPTDEFRAMYASYLLETPSGPLRVVSVHPFSPRNAIMDRDESWVTDVARREAQVQGASNAARAPGAPFVIVGDTNLPDGSVILRRHLGDLTDAFAEAGSGFGYTFPVKRPWMRIDRALAGPGVRFHTAFAGPHGASDHRPLFFELELMPRAGAVAAPP